MRLTPDQIRELPPFYRAQVEAEMARPRPMVLPYGQTSIVPARPAKARRTASRAEPEQTVRPPSMEPAEGETLYPGRVSVRIVSFRRRLLDPDNLCAKWFLDACRYSRLISDDRPQDITYEVSQIKVARKDEERTEITLSPLAEP